MTSCSVTKYRCSPDDRSLQLVAHSSRTNAPESYIESIVSYIWSPRSPSTNICAASSALVGAGCANTGIAQRIAAAAISRARIDASRSPTAVAGAQRSNPGHRPERHPAWRPALSSDSRGESATTGGVVRPFSDLTHLGPVPCPVLSAPSRPIEPVKPHTQNAVRPDLRPREPIAPRQQRHEELARQPQRRGDPQNERSPRPRQLVQPQQQQRRVIVGGPAACKRPHPLIQRARQLLRTERPLRAQFVQNGQQPARPKQVA